MSTFLTDLRYAIRMLAKSRAFSIIAVLALGLGIGANTAIFSVVNAVLLRPLPYPQADDLVILRERTASFPNGSVSYPNWLDWRASQHSFTDLALVRRDTFNMSIPGGDAAPERIGGARVSFNYLNILAMKPIIGRDLVEADDTAGSPPVVLIGETVWRTRFGSSQKVLGQQIIVDSRPGAGGNLAGEMAVRNEADGYTLLVAGQAILAINKALYKKLSYDPRPISPSSACWA